MTLETEAVLDRRAMRRRLSLWRALAVIAAAGLIIAVGFVGGDGFSIGKQDQIARVVIDGMITDNRDQRQQLRKIAEDRHVAAVVLFINSPGGTTTGGEALFEAIRDVAAKKPVVAQFGTLATSAAYIAGLASDHIVARGNTITGSVGVIFQWAEVSDLLSKIGVKMNEVKSGPLKASPSPFQPADEAGLRVAKDMIADSMRWFVSLVAARRGVQPSAIPGLTDGRIYTGREALAYKLIDEIGGEVEVRKWLEEKRGVPKGLKFVDWKPKRDAAYGLLGRAGVAIGRAIGGPFGELAHLLASRSGLDRLQLDGLVSVWQPSEN